MNKNVIIQACFDIINQKVNQVNLAIQDANSSLQDDTKSSAGDKYETSREMIQQDLNRYEQQLKVLNQDIEVLNRVQLQNSENATAAVGSVIQTDKGIYFLAVSIGQVKIDNQTIFCISSASPIGKVLIGKSVGDNFEFNGSKQNILSVS